MASTAAALLDELMGRDRNLAPTEKRKEIKWDDPTVIFNYSFCVKVIRLIHKKHKHNSVR